MKNSLMKLNDAKYKQKRYWKDLNRIRGGSKLSFINILSNLLMTIVYLYLKLSIEQKRRGLLKPKKQMLPTICLFYA